MSAPMSFSASLPDGSKHVISPAKTGPDTATIIDESWSPNSSQPHTQTYKLYNVRRVGDGVTASYRIFLVPVPVKFSLFADHVQLEAPGHDMAYPVTPAERAEAETFIADFSTGT